MFICYAHRGACEYAPENTITSFAMGIQMGANGIETDVRKTKDGVLVLFHDNTLERMTGEEGSIADYTYEELLRMRIRNANTGAEDIILTFEDFLRYFGFRNLHFAIELKVPDIEAEVLEMLDRFEMREKTVITSFHFDYIKKVKELRPDYKVGYLVREVNDEVLAQLAEIGAEQLCPRATQLTAELVREWKSLGYSIRAWGASNIQLMKAAYDAGVIGMTVNFPDRLVRYMVEKQ